MAKKDKLKLTAKGEMFTDFISKTEDLTKIGDTVKLKIDSEHILMYSMIGETAVLAFKSYQVKTDDYFIFDEFDYTLDYVIIGAKKFIKNFGFLNIKNKIEIDLLYKDSPDNDDIKHVRAISGTDTRLTLSNVGGEQYKIREMPKDKLNKFLDPENSKWSFNVSKEDFSDIRKLAQINEDRVININVTGGKVTFSELGKWSLDVDKIDEDSANLLFGKKYLSSVNQSEDIISFNVFETFILIKDKESNFMISFEQDFNAED